MTRRDELAAGLRRVHDRIAAACAAAGRDPEEVTLVVVTKTFPAGDVRLLYELGVADVGENRDQEAAAKARECADLALRWHFVGQLQRNKVRSVASYACAVHAVDRARLVPALDTAAGSSGAAQALDCLVQVDLDEDPTRTHGRGGARTEQVPELAALVAAAPHLRLRGLMAVAPLGRPPRPAFDRLALLAQRVRAEHPDATWLSAGMTGDLEDAVAAGATHVRVGSAILGNRPAAG